MRVFDFLCRVPEFGHASHTELEGLERVSVHLSVPANRWLMQSKRDLGAYFYLLSGQVETWHPQARVRAAGYRHFYPGCERARTRTPCQILRVDATHRALIIGRKAPQTAESESESESESVSGSKAGADADEKVGWIDKFLQSRMMSRLTKSEWQAVFRDSRQIDFAVGEVVFRQGSPGVDCHVVETGIGRIHRGGRTLKQIGPGDFFGEDAVIAASVRNAEVTAVTAMRTHAIKGKTFLDLVVPKGIRFVAEASGGIMLNLGGWPVAGAIPIDPMTLRERISEFDRRETYCLVGGTERARVLCAFLLGQQGVHATVVAAD